MINYLSLTDKEKKNYFNTYNTHLISFVLILFFINKFLRNRVKLEKKKLKEIMSEKKRKKNDEEERSEPE